MLRPFLRIDDELTLHLARHELAEAIFTAIDANREHLRRWLPWVEPTQSVEDTRAYIRESMAQNSSGTRLSTFILEGEHLVGSVGVVRFDKDHRSCELGYWLSEERQGRGIVTKACGALIGHLFQKKNLNRIEIKVASGNLRSQEVPLRLGFQKEGTLRGALYLYDEYHDVELFGLLRSDWKNRRK